MGKFGIRKVGESSVIHQTKFYLYYYLMAESIDTPTFPYQMLITMNLSNFPATYMALHSIAMLS